MRCSVGAQEGEGENLGPGELWGKGSSQSCREAPGSPTGRGCPRASLPTVRLLASECTGSYCSVPWGAWAGASRQRLCDHPRNKCIPSRTRLPQLLARLLEATQNRFVGERPRGRWEQADSEQPGREPPAGLAVHPVFAVLMERLLGVWRCGSHVTCLSPSFCPCKTGTQHDLPFQGFVASVRRGVGAPSTRTSVPRVCPSSWTCLLLPATPPPKAAASGPLGGSWWESGDRS